MRVLPFASLLLLSACGGGGGSGNGGGGSADPTEFSLSITDGPVDTAQQVVVEFDAVHIENAAGDELDFVLPVATSIDLLGLQGSASATILNSQEIPEGQYVAIRLAVNAESGVRDSYVVLEDGSEMELRIPSGGESGLKLNHAFSVALGSTTDFTIDFDLRKSVTNPPGLGEMLLRPSLRLVDNLEVGSLSGLIESLVITEACEDLAVNDGAVYLFPSTAEAPDDVSGLDTDPITSALVDDEWNYEIGFIEAGQYNVAFTCENDLDDPEVDDELAFLGFGAVVIEANTNTELNFIVLTTLP